MGDFSGGGCSTAAGTGIVFFVYKMRECVCVGILLMRLCKIIVKYGLLCNKPRFCRIRSCFRIGALRALRHSDVHEMFHPLQHTDDVFLSLEPLDSNSDGV